MHYFVLAHHKKIPQNALIHEAVIWAKVRKFSRPWILLQDTACRMLRAVVFLSTSSKCTSPTHLLNEVWSSSLEGTQGREWKGQQCDYLHTEASACLFLCLRLARCPKTTSPGLFSTFHSLKQQPPLTPPFLMTLTPHLHSFEKFNPPSPHPASYYLPVIIEPPHLCRWTNLSSLCRFVLLSFHWITRSTCHTWGFLDVPQPSLPPMWT